MQNQKPAELNVVQNDPIGNTWALPEGAIVRFGTGDLNRVKSSLSPDGKYLAVGTGVGLWWYDTTSMMPISLWETERGFISSIHFSHDGRQIVIRNWDQILKVMDVQTAECIYEMKVQGSNITLSSNNKWIASCDQQGIVRVYDIQKGEFLAQMDRGEHEWKSNDIPHLEFSPDGNFLAGTAQNPKMYSPDDQVLNPDTEGEQTYLWNPETGEVILKFAGADFVFSADSRLLAAASPDESHSSSDAKRIDRCVSVWDVVSRKRIAHFTEHTDRAINITFSPCSKFIASCDETLQTLREWELATGTQKKVYENCLDAFYSPDGILFGVVFVSDDTIEVWNVDSQQKMLELPQNVYFGLGKKKVFTYMREHQFQIADIIANKLADSIQKSSPIEHRIGFAMPDPLVVWVDDRTLASGSHGQGIVLWDIVEKRVCERLLESEKIHVFTVLPNGKMLAALVSSKYDATKVWDVANPEKPIAEFNANVWWERHQAFSPAGDRMAAGSTEDGKVYVWNLQQPEHPMILTGHAKKHIYSLAFSPNGKRLVTGSDDNTARLWDVELGKHIATLPMNEHCTPIKVLFSPCGNIIAGGVGSEIRLWCTKQFTTLRTIPQPDNNQRVYALAFSPCGNYLASGTWWEKGMQKMAIRLWDVATGENIHTFWGHNSDVQSLAFSPNGTILASGSYDGTILIWDLKPYL